MIIVDFLTNQSLLLIKINKKKHKKSAFFFVHEQ